MARRLLTTLILFIYLASIFLIFHSENGISQNNSKVIFTIEKDRYLAMYNQTISVNFSAENLVNEYIPLNIELKNLKKSNNEHNQSNQSYAEIDILGNSTQNYTLFPFSNLRGTFELKPHNSHIAKGYFLLSVILDGSLFFEKEIIVSFLPEISAKILSPCTNQGLGYFELYSNSTIYANFTNYSPYELNLFSVSVQKRFRDIKISLQPYESKIVSITFSPPKRYSKSAHIAQFETLYFRIYMGNQLLPYSNLFGFDIHNEELINISSFTFYGVYFVGAVAHLEPQAEIEPGLDSKFKVFVYSVSNYENVSLHVSLFESYNKPYFLNYNTKTSIEVANWSVEIGDLYAIFNKIYEFNLRFNELSSPYYFVELNLSMKGQSLIFFEDIDVIIKAWSKAWSVSSYPDITPVKYIGQRNDEIVHVATKEITSFKCDFLLYENEKGSLYPYDIKDKMKLLQTQNINIDLSTLFRNEYWMISTNLSWDFHYSHTVYLYLRVNYQNVTYWSDCIKFLGAYQKVENFEEIILYPIAFIFLSISIPISWRIGNVKREY